MWRRQGLQTAGTIYAKALGREEVDLFIKQKRPIETESRNQEKWVEQW